MGLSLLSLLDVVLVSRMNVPLGISDKTMVLFGSALSDAINQFKYVLIFLVAVFFYNLFHECDHLICFGICFYHPSTPCMHA